MIASIRQVSKSALKEETKPKQENDEAFYNSQKYEVLYCGKVESVSMQNPQTWLFLLGEKVTGWLLCPGDSGTQEGFGHAHRWLHR